MTDTTVGIKVVADTSDVTVELGKIDRAAVKTAGELEKVGKGNGFKRTGEDAAAGASKMEAAQRNMIGSIQRTTAAMEAGGKTTAKYYELLAQQRGVDTGALAPYLAQLRAVEAAQAKSNAALGGAAPALDKMGISAKQTAAALRGVPAQFTDIFTSLQGGQAPLTVFLQQGGQLKDMFGGAGNAARAMGGYLVGLINPFTVAAAAAGGLVIAYNQGANEAQAYTRALVMTGNAAGTTADQLGDMARNISDTVGTQGAAAEALAAMAGTGRVAAANLEYFSEVAVKAQRTLGIGAVDMAKDFAELGKTPLSASERLTEKYRYLTAAVYEQIKAAEQQGRVDDAAAIAQTAFAKAFDERAAQVEKSLGSIERGWRSVTSAAKSGWDAILDIGRQETKADELGRLSQLIANKQTMLGNRRARTGVQDDSITRTGEAEIAALKAKQELLQSAVREQNRANEAAATAARIAEASIAWSKEGDKYLDRKAQKEREIAAAVALGAQANIDAETIKKRVAAIEEKYAEKSTIGIDAQIEAIRRRGQVEEAVAKRSLDLLSEKRKAGSISEDDYLTRAAEVEQQSLARSRAALEAELALLKRKKDSLKEQASIAGQIAKNREDAISREMKLEGDLLALDQKNTRLAMENYARVFDASAAVRDGLVSQAQAQKDENEQIGLTKIELANLTATRLEELAVRKEADAQIAKSLGDSGQLAQSYRDQAAALRDRANAVREGAGKQVGIDEAKATADAWKRAAESIENSLTDALMRGFESGKSFGRNLMDTLKNMFKTLILKPTISGILAPVSGAMASAFGAGTAQAATSSVGGSAVGGGLGAAMGIGGAIKDLPVSH